MNTFAHVLLTLALTAGAAFGLSSTDFGADIAAGVQAGAGAALDLFEDNAGVNISAGADASAGTEVSSDESAGAQANAEVGAGAGVDASAEQDGGFLGLDLEGLLGLGLSLGD